VSQFHFITDRSRPKLGVLILTTGQYVIEAMRFFVGFIQNNKIEEKLTCYSDRSLWRPLSLSLEPYNAVTRKHNHMDFGRGMRE